MVSEFSSTNYVPKEYEDIFLELMLAAWTRSLVSSDDKFLDYINLDEDIENTIILELSVVALILSYVYLDLTATYNAQNISIASGQDLDILGLMYFSRQPADYAVTDIVYSIDDALGYNIDIPVGSRIKDEDDTVTFATTEAGILLAGQTEVTIPGKCQTVGKIGNMVADTLIVMVDQINEIDDVTNPLGAYGGREDETDESYRLRLFNWKYILIRGTWDAIIYAITSVTSVVGYYVDQYWDGYGSTKIIIDPPLQVTLNLVTSAIDTWKAVDEPFRILGVEEVAVDISCLLNISLDEPMGITDATYEQTKLKAESFINIFLEGGLNADGTDQPALGIGVDYTNYKCGAYLADQLPELKDITWTYPTAPVTIASHQKAISGTITVTVV